MKTAQANGARLAWRIDGPQDAPAVMLSNSLMSTHVMWDPQLAALTERFRVLRYDTRGHGASEVTPGPYNQGVAGLVDSTIQRWFVPSFVAREPDAIAWVRKMILQTTPEGYIACASAVRDMSQTHILREIRVPTQIIVGRDDPACTLAASEALHREIQGSTLHVIDDAAHLSNIEKPEQFTRLLVDFISAQAAAKPR